MIFCMTRITVDVNDKWLKAAQVVLGTDTKVATINEALRAQALKAEAAQQQVAARASLDRHHDRGDGTSAAGPPDAWGPEPAPSFPVG